MPHLIEFDTERLRLRQWKSSDFRPFAAMNADPLVMACLPSLMTPEQSDALARQCQMLISERGWGLWAAELKSTQAFIGFVGLHTPLTDLPISSVQQPLVEIGWRLARPYWGMGLATEAAKRGVEIGFETLDLREIVSFTVPDNLRSRSVMERLGMRESGYFDHPRLPEGSRLRRHCLYRLPRPADDRPRQQKSD